MPKRQLLQIGPLEIDRAAYRVTRAGRELSLSIKEFALLDYLAQYRGEAISRATILRAVFGYATESVSNVVDVHISSLRQKIDAPGEPSLIGTVRGVGYRLDPRG